MIKKVPEGRASTVKNDQNSRFLTKKICSRGCAKANPKARSGIDRAKLHTISRYGEKI